MQRSVEAALEANLNLVEKMKQTVNKTGEVLELLEIGWGASFAS